MHMQHYPGHAVCYKTNLNIFKNTDIIPSIFTHHKGMNKENWKIYKYVGIKWHILKQPMSQIRGHNENYKISEKNKN